MHPLVTPAALAGHLSEPGWVVFDCRYSLTDPDYGRTGYEQGHLPGARFADVHHDLTGAVGPGTGRHPLPPWDAFCAWLGSQGVRRETTVVGYDDGPGSYASRLWWMLRALGHERVAVLDGGLARWTREGRRMESGTPQPKPTPPKESEESSVYRAQPDPSLQITLDDVERRLDDPALLLVDARSGERFRGETEPLDPRAGHIPGAINLFNMGNVDADGGFLPPGRLRERLLETYTGHSPQNTVHYCGSGIAACHNLLAHAVAGLPPGRLYVGSWSQWCADPHRPGEQGPAQPRAGSTLRG